MTGLATYAVLQSQSHSCVDAQYWLHGHPNSTVPRGQSPANSCYSIKSEGNYLDVALLGKVTHVTSLGLPRVAGPSSCRGAHAACVKRVDGSTQSEVVT